MKKSTARKSRNVPRDLLYFAKLREAGRSSHIQILQRFWKANHIAPRANIQSTPTGLDKQAGHRPGHAGGESTGNYEQEQGVWHIDPIAQDFMAAFDVGGSDKHIHMIDANGVNMVTIRALYHSLQEKEGCIQALNTRIRKLEITAGISPENDKKIKSALFEPILV